MIIGGMAKLVELLENFSQNVKLKWLNNFIPPLHIKIIQWVWSNVETILESVERYERKMDKLAAKNLISAAPSVTCPFQWDYSNKMTKEKSICSIHLDILLWKVLKENHAKPTSLFWERVIEDVMFFRLTFLWFHTLKTSPAFGPFNF